MNNQSEAEIDLSKDFNVVPEPTEAKYLNQARACPFLKWAGGGEER